MTRHSLALPASTSERAEPTAIGVFTDVTSFCWAVARIKQLVTEEITSGCSAGNYYPDVTVTRTQMAIFLLKAKYGSSYSPSAAAGVFTDVPVGYWADKWIEQLAVEGISPLAVVVNIATTHDFFRKKVL